MWPFRITVPNDIAIISLLAWQIQRPFDPHLRASQKKEHFRWSRKGLDQGRILDWGSPDAWVSKWPFGKGLGRGPNYFFRKVRGRPFLAYCVC